MKVAIRDDDTSYFTDPAALERVYGSIWSQAPVCLAVVPFAIGYKNPGIPEAHWNDGRQFPLKENPALVDRLPSWLRHRLITVALHGYTHQDYPGGYEFQVAPDPDRRIASGRSYLQTALSTRIRI